MEILVNKKTRAVNGARAKIGNDGENLQELLVFKFDDEFVNGQARLEYELNNTKNYITMTKVDETYTLPIQSILTKEGVLYFQLVIDEGTNDEDVPIFKSDRFPVIIDKSINAVEEAPEGYEQWIEIANAKLNQIDNLDINATKEDNVATITITKKDGTEESVNIYDGEKGDKGDTGAIGPAGQDGYTPIKGIDYFTQQDIDSLNIPSKTSDLLNDNGFIINTVDNLTNYYLKSETYTKTEVQNLISTIQQFHYEVVQELPTTGETNIIYLVPKTQSQTNNYYDEYVYANGWEKIGDTQIDLSNYVTITQLNTALSFYTTTTDLTTLLNNKVDKVQGKGLSTNDYTNEDKETLNDLDDEVNGEAQITGEGSTITLNNTLNSLLSIELEPTELSQEETPSPSNPQDIHTISGNNTIKICGKNLFNKNDVENNKRLDSNGQPISNSATGFSLTGYIEVQPNTQYTYSRNTTSEEYYVNISEYTKDKTHIERLYKAGSTTTYTFTTPNNCEYLRINDATTNLSTIQLEKNTSASSYEPYQSVSYPIYLPVENLFDKDNISLGYVQEDGTLSSDNAYRTSDFIPIQPNTSYYKTLTISPRTKYYDGNKQPLNTTTYQDISIGGMAGTFTTPNNAKYLRFSFPFTGSSAVDVNSIMLNKGTRANSYTPYGTPALEYSKIGSYSDRIFKNIPEDEDYSNTRDEGAWYIKKNKQKIVLNGTENWTGGTENESSPDYKYIYCTGFDFIPNSYNCISDRFKAYTSGAIGGGTATTEDIIGVQTSGNYNVRVMVNKNLLSDISSTTAVVNSFKAFLQENNTTLYATTSVPTYTKLSDELSAQLEALYNATSKKGHTNISQVNNDLPFNIKAIAYNNSLNGKYESLKEEKEDKSNKVTSISNESTDTQYPSAKCLFDALNSLPTGDDVNIDKITTFTRYIDLTQIEKGIYYFDSSVSSVYVYDDVNKTSYTSYNKAYLLIVREPYSDELANNDAFAILFYSSNVGFNWTSFKKSNNDISKSNDGLGTLLNSLQQNISGEKIFNTIPKQNGTTAPTDNMQFTNKKYVDDKVGGLIVTLTQSDYDDLVDAGTIDANVYYFIEEEQAQTLNTNSLSLNSLSLNAPLDNSIPNINTNISSLNIIEPTVEENNVEE